MMKVWVTGAGGALGSAVVQRFISAGHFVVAWEAPRAGNAAPLATETKTETKNVQWVHAHLGSAADVRARCQELLLTHPRVDAWIHCAGGFRFAQVDTISDEDLDFLIDSNLKSTVYLMREILPQMKKQNFGRIALISSRATLGATSGLGPYAASKAALNALVSAAADEVRDFDITVNAVLPTTIDTPANRAAMPKANPAQWVSRESLADILFQLTQPFGKPIHGALIPVAGRL